MPKIFLAKGLLIKLAILYVLCILDSGLKFSVQGEGYLVSIAYCPFFHFIGTSCFLEISLLCFLTLGF